MGLWRVLLAVSVFMAHSEVPKGYLRFLTGFGGANAVEVFFVISGFYIALILDKSYNSKLNFFKNRLLKIYPMYFIICFLVLMRYFINSEQGSELFSFPGKALALGVFANSTLIGTDWLMFLQYTGNQFHFGNFYDSEFLLPQMLFVPPAWSLGIELTFYFLAPIVCKFKTRTLVGVIGTLFILRGLSYLSGLNNDPWTYRFFPFEFPLFLMGILLYRVKREYKPKKRIKTINLYLFLIAIYVMFPSIVSKLEVGRLIQISVLLIVTAIAIFFSPENSKDKSIGELSFPIYISHMFIISSLATALSWVTSVTPHLELLKSAENFLLISLILTFLVSILLLQAMKPIERIRDRNRSK